MTTRSNRGESRGPSYEKMLVADAFFIFGCILLSFGLGLSFYNVPVVAQDDVAPLILENDYGHNYSVPLDQGDTLRVGVKPYSLANLTLVLNDTGSQSIIVLKSSIPGYPLNFSYKASASGGYNVFVFENLTDKANKAVYCEVEVMTVVSLNSPIRPYFVYGIITVIFGIGLLIYSGKAGIKVKNVEEWSELKSYLLPGLFLASTIGFALFSSAYVVFSMTQLGLVGDILLVTFSALNVFSLLVSMANLQGKPLHVFQRVLLIAIMFWIFTSSIPIFILPYSLASYLYGWSSDTFLRSLQGLAGMTSAFFQIETLAVIIVVAYCLSLQYIKHRFYNYTFEVQVVEAGTLKSLIRRLGGALSNNSLKKFFEVLREEDLETSAFLFFLVSDYVKSGVNSFTYHKVIADRREVFSKDIYERKPAENILQPLGYVKVAGEDRFKTFSLQTERPMVNKLVSLFRSSNLGEEKTNLTKWAGVDLLKERRMKYSGQSKEKN